MIINFSEASDRNKDPILDVLKQYLNKGQKVLEVGSGAGQHAIHISANMPEIRWQPTEILENLQSLRSNLEQYSGVNVEPPFELNVCSNSWSERSFSGIYTANTLHIIGENLVEHFFRGAAEVLEKDGLLVVYGPFKYQGKYTSESNARFDQWLQSRDPLSAIRSFEYVDKLASDQGFKLEQDIQMPANNQILIWRKTAL